MTSTSFSTCQAAIGAAGYFDGIPVTTSGTVTFSSNTATLYGSDFISSPNYLMMISPNKTNLTFYIYEQASGGLLPDMAFTMYSAAGVQMFLDGNDALTQISLMQVAAN
jgi:hypothetical protein